MKCFACHETRVASNHRFGYSIYSVGPIETLLLFGKKMMLWRSLALILPLAATPIGCLASQDTAYYPGFSNPNVGVGDGMYYRDAINVIQDLMQGEFSALYIKYHGCVYVDNDFVACHRNII